jgi:alkaline phosphatase D
MLLSGDRHISEFAKKDIDGLSYPLYEFTSSGLTHALNRENTEPNKYRIGKNVVVNSFGIIRFDLNEQRVTMEIRGQDNKILRRWSYNSRKEF